MASYCIAAYPGREAVRQGVLPTGGLDSGKIWFLCSRIYVKGEDCIMKTVFFIRHAKSSWKDPEWRDYERPLNKRGLRDAPFMAKLLVGKSGEPDAILSSPAVRALTTARFFADAAAIANSDIQVDERIYHAYPGDIFSLLQQQTDDRNCLWIVGHNPTFTAMANSFSNDYIPNVPTCGIVEVQSPIEKWEDFAPGRGKRMNFFFPKQYFD